MTAPRYTLYNKAEYLADLIDRSQNLGHGDRMDLASMTLEPRHPEIQRLLDALAAAAHRGARVSLACDAINFMVNDKTRGLGPLIFTTRLRPERLRGPYRRLHKTLQDLRRAGVTVTLTHVPKRPFTVPFAGRSHIKYAIINDRIYLGGCNLDFPLHVDMMCAWQDDKTADWLHTQIGAMQRSANWHRALGDLDLRHDLADGSSILLDVGKRRQSAILDEALRLIDQAEKHIYLTTQYFPSYGTAKHLRAAHQRGVRVHLVYNHVSNMHRLGFVHRFNMLLLRRLLPHALFRHELPAKHAYMHAKILVTDKAALLGSHNYVKPGVTLGTAEIALLRPSPAFATQLVTWLEQQLTATRPID